MSSVRWRSFCMAQIVVFVLKRYHGRLFREIFMMIDQLFHQAIVQTNNAGDHRSLSALHEDIFWHDDVIKWKHYWPFVWGIHQSPVNSLRKGQWRGALMFSYICALNKRLIKQSWGWWVEAPSCSLWRQCNVKNIIWWYFGKELLWNETTIFMDAQWGSKGIIRHWYKPSLGLICPYYTYSWLMIFISNLTEFHGKLQRNLSVVSNYWFENGVCGSWHIH